MKTFFSLKGAGQTEYIILIVLVSMLSLFAVERYGGRIKSLFEKTTLKLSLMEGGDGLNNGEENGTDTNTGEDANEPSQPSEDNSSQDSVRDDNSNPEQSGKTAEQCRREYENLMNEKRDEQREFASRINQIGRLEAIYRGKANYFFRLASHYGWGWGGFWHHHSSTRRRQEFARRGQMYLNLANQMAERRRQEVERHNAFLENWDLKMSEWQAECGNSP